jgi:rubrerythrin
MKKTIENLTKAFVGESQARNRYAMYAKIAKKEGFEEIAENFTLTANQEAEHAKWLMRMINELKGDMTEYDEITIETGAPTILKDTKENLKAAIGGENFEYTSMYPEFAKIADGEKLPEIAARLTAIASAEANHEDRYKKFLDSLENNTVFKKSSKTTWICRKCGYAHESEEATSVCPSCGHPQAYFEAKK